MMENAVGYVLLRFLAIFVENNEDMSEESNEVKDMRKQLDNAYNKLTSNNIIKVKHMKDTAKYRPAKDRSWKEYWERKSGLQFPTSVRKCACCGKLTIPKDFVGAHIEEVNDTNKQYIYPLCNSCNSRYREGNDKSPEFNVIKSYCVPFSLDEAVEIVERPDEQSEVHL